MAIEAVGIGIFCSNAIAVACGVTGGGQPPGGQGVLGVTQTTRVGVPSHICTIGTVGGPASGCCPCCCEALIRPAIASPNCCSAGAMPLSTHAGPAGRTAAGV